MISYQRIDTFPLPFPVLNYLDQAIKRTPATVSKIEDVIRAAMQQNGVIYAVLSDGDVIGAIYLRRYVRTICPVLIGGKNMEKWGFYEFMYKLCKESGIEKVQWIGRKGWKGLFPKSSVIGHVYEHEVNAY